MSKIRLAIAGVGNCASSLVQGLEYYRDADPADEVPGLMHVELGGYHIRDIELVAAFDVDAEQGRPRRRQGDLGRATTTRSGSPRCPTSASRCSAARPSTASASSTARRARSRRPSRSTSPRCCATPRPTCSCPTCRSAPRRRRSYYAQACLDAGVAFVNAIPVFIASDPEWAAKFTDGRRADRRRRHQEPGRRHHRAPHARPPVRGPRHGDRPHVPAELRREHGLHEHARAQAAEVEEDLEDAVGHQPDRPGHQRPATCTSARRDHVPWLEDRKWAYIRLEGRNFGDVPLNVELKLEVQDSPNSAGVIIDAAALRQGRAWTAASAARSRARRAYFMKSPPVQVHDDERPRRMRRGVHPRRQPDDPGVNRRVSRAGGRTASTSARRRALRRRRSPTRSRALRLLGNLEGKRVLDLGCGAGARVRRDGRRGAKVIAVDESADRWRSARRLCDARGRQGRAAPRRPRRAGVRARRHDRRGGQRRTGSAAVDDLDRVFRQVHRVLRPEAPLVFSLPHPMSLAVGDPPVAPPRAGARSWTCDRRRVPARSASCSPGSRGPTSGSTRCSSPNRAGRGVPATLVVRARKQGH